MSTTDAGYHLRGVVPPAITPFDSAGRLDLATLEGLIDFWAERVQGLFICGTYGSGALMDTSERKEVAETALRAARGRLPIIVHAGSTTTAISVQLAVHAQSAGATAVAAVPPYYYSHSSDNVKNYFEALVRAVDLPVYVYNNPKTVGYPVSPALVAELADLGVRGLKDSSFDVLYYYEVRRVVRAPGFDFVAGSEALMLPCWLAGARAFIAGLANCLPEPVTALLDSLQGGRYEEAAERQKRVLGIRNLLHHVATIPAVHKVLEMRGVFAGYPRAPFQPLGPEAVSLVARALKEEELT